MLVGMLQDRHRQDTSLRVLLGSRWLAPWLDSVPKQLWLTGKPVSAHCAANVLSLASLIGMLC